MDLSLSINAIKSMFSFPFHDPNWKNKFLIGSGISFAGMVVPIFPWIVVLGYIARLIRAGVNNEDTTRLPEWDNLNELLIDGLRMFGVAIIFTLPSVIIMFAGWLFYMAGMLGTAGIENNPAGAGGRVSFMLFSMLFMFFSMGIGTILSFAAWVVMPAAQAHVAIHRRFTAAFDWRGWGQVLRANLSGFVICMGLFYVLYVLLMLVFQFLSMTLVLCIFAPLIWFPGIFYMMLIVYRIVGHAYGEGAAKVSALSAATSPEVHDMESPAAA